MNLMANAFRRFLPVVLALLIALLGAPLHTPSLMAQQTGVAAPTVNPQAHQPGGEANLVIPDLSQVEFLGIKGRSLLLGGLAICALGLLFGLVIYQRLKTMAVHESMREVSELIYETCKTYLITQGKFILVLEVFIGAVIAL